MDYLDIHPSDAVDLPKTLPAASSPETQQPDSVYQGRSLSKLDGKMLEDTGKVSSLVSSLLQLNASENGQQVSEIAKHIAETYSETLIPSRVNDQYQDKFTATIGTTFDSIHKSENKENLDVEIQEITSQSNLEKTMQTASKISKFTTSDSKKLQGEASSPPTILLDSDLSHEISIEEQMKAATDKLEARKLIKLEKQRAKEEKIAKAKKREENASGSIINTPTPLTVKLDSNEKIQKLRYSQDSIADKSSDNFDLFHVIKDTGWKAGITMMGVEMPDGQYTSLDNRRLHALKRIVNEVASDFFKQAAQKPAIHIYSHDHTSEKIQKEVRRLKNLSENLERSPGPSLEESGLKEGTIGALVYYRMRGGGEDSVNENNIHGFESDPVVRSSSIATAKK